MFQKASSIKVPEILFHTIKTGKPEIDKTFSDTEGIVPSQVTFITGVPGSGKTTVSLLIACLLSMITKKVAAFVSLEMSDFQLKHSAKKIPGFDQFIMVETEFCLEDIFTNLRKMKPCVIVIDSVQKGAKMLVKQKMAKNFNHGQQLIVDEFYKFAKETMIPIFLIGHCTKSGAYFGPAGLEHEVDSHMKVTYDKEIDVREWSFGKNRFGGFNDPQMFGISSTSVWIGTPYTFDMEVEPKHVPEPLPLASAAIRMNQTLSQFRERCKGKPAIGLSEIKLCSKEIIEYLKVLDNENIMRNSYIGNSAKVKLTYLHKGVAHCWPKTGEIQIGDVMAMTKFGVGPQTVPGGTTYTVGYRKEQPFIQRNCKTREDLFEWVICHEWVHLYKGMQTHTVEFFKTVENLFQRYRASLEKTKKEHTVTVTPGALLDMATQAAAEAGNKN